MDTYKEYFLDLDKKMNDRFQTEEDKRTQDLRVLNMRLNKHGDKLKKLEEREITNFAVISAIISAAVITVSSLIRFLFRKVRR